MYGTVQPGLRTTCSTVPRSSPPAGPGRIQFIWNQVSPAWRSGSFIRIKAGRSAPPAPSSVTSLEKFFGTWVPGYRSWRNSSRRTAKSR